MVKKKSRKSPTPTEHRICNACGMNFYFNGASEQGLAAIQSMISHYEKKHPDRMAKCFDDYGQTWNSQYDQCLKALHNHEDRLQQAIKERDEVAAQQRSLAAKLNAIVLVLRTNS